MFNMQFEITWVARSMVALVTVNYYCTTQESELDLLTELDTVTNNNK